MCNNVPVTMCVSVTMCGVYVSNVRVYLCACNNNVSVYLRMRFAMVFPRNRVGPDTTRIMHNIVSISRFYVMKIWRALIVQLVHVHDMDV